MYLPFRWKASLWVAFEFPLRSQLIKLVSKEAPILDPSLDISWIGPPLEGEDLCTQSHTIDLAIVVVIQHAVESALRYVVDLPTKTLGRHSNNVFLMKHYFLLAGRISLRW